jgi:antitoxin ParD1/3/4
MMPTSNVNLTPELEQFVKSQVSAGQFNNASEVHRAALAAMAQQREEREIYLDRLRREVDLGLNDLEVGHSSMFTSHQALDSHLDSILDRVEEDIS